MTTPEKIFERVYTEPNTGCWLWGLTVDTVTGYGKISVGRRTRLAHRVSYEAHVGPIGDGMTIDHLCRVRACVNPDHLEAVSMRVNIRRSSRTRHSETTCADCGHDFDGACIRKENGSLYRYCLGCRAKKSALWKAANREKYDAWWAANRPAVNAKRREKRRLEKAS